MTGDEDEDEDASCFAAAAGVEVGVADDLEASGVSVGFASGVAVGVSEVDFSTEEEVAFSVDEGAGVLVALPLALPGLSKGLPVELRPAPKGI
jgi:hypothetical protein